MSVNLSEKEVPLTITLYESELDFLKVKSEELSEVESEEVTVEALIHVLLMKSVLEYKLIYKDKTFKQMFREYNNLNRLNKGVVRNGF